MINLVTQLSGAGGQRGGFGNFDFSSSFSDIFEDVFGDLEILVSVGGRDPEEAELTRGE